MRAPALVLLLAITTGLGCGGVAEPPAKVPAALVVVKRPTECAVTQYRGDLSGARVGQWMTYKTEASGATVTHTVKVVADGWVEYWIDSLGYLWEVKAGRIATAWAALKNETSWTPIAVNQTETSELYLRATSGDGTKRVPAGEFACHWTETGINNSATRRWYSTGCGRLFQFVPESGGLVAIDAPGSKTWLDSQGENGTPTFDLPKAAARDWIEAFSDDFQRADGASLGEKWYEYEDQGVAITVEKGCCRFSGKCTGKPYFLTSLELDTPRANFRAFEVTLIPDQVAACEYGIAVLTSRPNTNPNASWMGLWLGFDLSGKLRRVLGDTISANSSILALVGNEMKAKLPDPKCVRLKIERGAMGNQGQTKCLNIYVWDPATSEYNLIEKNLMCLEGAGADYRVMIWGRCDKGASYSFYADDAKILEKKPK